MSFGHFTSVSIPKTDLIDFDNATALKIGINVELETSNSGWIINENEIKRFLTQNKFKKVLLIIFRILFPQKVYLSQKLVLP